MHRWTWSFLLLPSICCCRDSDTDFVDPVKAALGAKAVEESDDADPGPTQPQKQKKSKSKKKSKPVQ